MKRSLPDRSSPGTSAASVLFVFTLLALFNLLPAGLALGASGTLGPARFGLHWNTSPNEPCDGQDVSLLFHVCECQVDLRSAALDSSGRILVRLRIDPNIVCAACRPDTQAVHLGALAAGRHDIHVRTEWEYTSPPDSTWPSGDFDSGLIQFAVRRLCGPDTAIPFLERVVIGTPPCATCPPRVCPNDSIDVFLEGTFDNTCTFLADVQLVPQPVPLPNGDPRPGPPTVRLIYGDQVCEFEHPCVLQAVPWTREVRLPALPHLGGFSYELPIEAWRAGYCGPNGGTPTLVGSGLFPFVVAESCSTLPSPGACYNLAWGDGVPGTRCDATYDYNRPATLKFKVGSTLPIGGVEGTLALDTHALVIDAIQAARPNWVVQWSRNSDGSVRFIAFASAGGAAIPGQPDGAPQDLLEVRVGPGPVRSLLPDHATLAGRDLLVSGSTGLAIPACPVRATIDPPSSVALLCRGGRCDVNADGHSDVRDLVVMVNCLFPPPNVRLDCPVDSSGSGLDCNGDGHFALDDVFCCARAMLGAPGPGVPPGGDSLRAAPDIAVRFGLPRAGADGTLEVPLVLSGMAGVAAARLDVRYPEARYEVLAVDFSGAPTSWWTMHEVVSGRVALAILDLAGLDAPGGPSPAPASTAPVEALLRLRLRGGAVAGGELTLAAHEFAAGDGVTLATPNAEGSVELGAAGRVALTTPRPNPFAASTSFALTLPVAGPVDVGVFNAAGRRVATLLREDAAAAGVYTLGWNGSDEGGGRAAGGVYFVCVVTGAGDTARKLLFLPGAAR